jgi:hypothetical protein
MNSLHLTSIPFRFIWSIIVSIVVPSPKHAVNMTFCGPARDTVLTNRQTEKLNFDTCYVIINTYWLGLRETVCFVDPRLQIIGSRGSTKHTVSRQSQSISMFYISGVKQVFQNGAEYNFIIFRGKSFKIHKKIVSRLFLSNLNPDFLNCVISENTQLTSPYRGRPSIFYYYQE